MDPVLVNDLAATLLREQAADLVVGLNRTKKRVVRQVLSHGVARGLSDQVLARRLAEVMGLDERRARAVENHRKGLLDAGVPPSRVQRQTSAFANRLLRQRVRLIAEHEVRVALMRAQRLVWKVMQENGDYSPYAVRVTRVHRDDRLCSVCRPQNGSRRSLGRDLTEGPPFHPRCRCEEEVSDRGVPA